MTDGPTNAPVLFVGEAPGREEMLAGKPFVGRTGQYVRRTLTRLKYGDVRYANVIPTKLAVPKSVYGMTRLVDEWWASLSGELAGRRLIVACGRAALYRLTGRTELLKYHGGMWRTSDIHAERTGLPSDAIVVCIQHPAAVMRTKTGAGYAKIERTLTLARRYITKGFEHDFCGLDLDVEVVRGARLDMLDHLLAGSSAVAIDTEFDSRTGVPFMVGLTVDGRVVHSLPFNESTTWLLKRHMLRRDLLKIAHYHVADTEAMRRVGVDTCAPWFDTLEAFSHLYSDLQVGLPHASSFYLHGLHNWKDMAHDSPEYNAIDVAVAYRLWQHTSRELSDEGMLDVFMDERMPASVILCSLEVRGMHVDEKQRALEVARSREREAVLLAEIAGQVAPVFARRILGAAVEQQRELDARDTVTGSALACAIHESYDGLRKKRWAQVDGCTCEAVYEASHASRATRKAALDRANKARGRASKWQVGGFNPGSPEQLRWLLYDKKGYGLPMQRLHGKPTANADAIAKLLGLERVRALPEVARALLSIKEVGHLRKMRGTFLFDGKESRGKITEHGTVHPPYRAFGTGTGRPAGGADDATGERRASPYSFNVLNYPEECRGIIVPFGTSNTTPSYVVAPAEQVTEEEEMDDDELEAARARGGA